MKVSRRPHDNILIMKRKEGSMEHFKLNVNTENKNLEQLAKRLQRLKKDPSHTLFSLCLVGLTIYLALASCVHK